VNDCSRPDLANPIDDAFAVRNDPVTEKGGQGRAIEPSLEWRQPQERAKLGGKRNAKGALDVEQGLNPEAISNQRKSLRFAVPKREREHPPEPLQRIVQAPCLYRFQDHLGVRMSAPHHPDTPPLQVLANLGRVVDLTVVGDAVSPRVRPHRLLAPLAEIHDRQPSMAEPNAHLAVEEDPGGIGAAMDQRGRHGFDPWSGGAFGYRMPAPESCYAAHVGPSFPQKPSELTAARR
jgi:hypothetical protein